MNIRKPQGYWKDFDNVKKELLPLIEKYSRMPSATEMNKEGLGSLSRHIYTHHGSIFEVAKKLNLQNYDESIGRNIQNTWNKEKLVEDFILFIKEHNYTHYPSKSDFSKYKSKLLTGYKQVFGTYEKFKEHLITLNIILDNKPKPIKWTYEIAIDTLKEIIDRTGHLPPMNDLDKINLGGLRGYIIKNKLLDKIKKHFGIDKKCGAILTKDGDYVRSNYELLFDNFLSYNNIKHEVGKQIIVTDERNFCYDFKLVFKEKIYYIEIWGYSDNISNIEKQYNDKRIIKEEFYKINNLNLISIENKIFLKNYYEIYSYFKNLILIYDENIIIKDIDIEYFIYGYYYTKERLFNELHEIVKNNNGVLPNIGYFIEIKNNTIIYQIKKHGGINKIKEWF